MMPKKDRTTEQYLRAGVSARLLKAVWCEFREIETVLFAPEIDALIKLRHRIDIFISRAEDRMFADHPELSNEYLDVFYGGLDTKPRNEVDRMILIRVRERLEKLLEVVNAGIGD